MAITIAILPEKIAVDYVVALEESADDTEVNWHIGLQNRSLVADKAVAEELEEGRLEYEEAMELHRRVWAIQDKLLNADLWKS